MTIMADFEDNAVGNLKRQVWEAGDAEIDGSVIFFHEEGTKKLISSL